MDYGRAVRFPLDDPGWVGKIIIGSLVGLVPILNFAQQGYGLEIIRRVATGDREELPGWDGLGRYIVKGLGVSVGGFLYALPGLLVWAILFVLGKDSPAVTVISVLFLFLYMLALVVVFPAATTRYALTGEWASMFDFRWVLAFTAQNLGHIILVLLFIMVLGIVASIVGTLALFIGVVVTSFWVILATNHLYGQVASESKVR